jgi:hypothetical protein
MAPVALETPWTSPSQGNNGGSRRLGLHRNMVVAVAVGRSAVGSAGNRI